MAAPGRDRDFSHSLRGVHCPDAGHVGVREARNGGNVLSGVDLRAIAAEILGDIPAVAEEEHDVPKIACVIEAEGVAEFVKAGQIDNAVSEKIVRTGATRDIRAQGFHVGPDEDNRSAPAVHNQWLRLPIFSAARCGPVEPNQRGRFAR